ncbi:MAG: serine hydroxymethyltransferase [Planctomycetota bacterium]|nr:serine hydroxymethyltransferase [Planctomycetota bacterium]
MFAYPSGKDLPSSLVLDLVHAEARRQRNELVLIPSESICFPEVAEVVGSDFGNIYAEGQPDLRLSRASARLAFDEPAFRAWHRRLSDGRFYRGCLESDRVELVAKRNIAEAFSKLDGSPPADAIHVNVQALSGAPANLGVYVGLLEHGDTLLTLDLCHGGHLSHGSPFNVSGKQYKVFHYGIDTKAEGLARRLDYDRIRKQALERRPRMLVAGSSAYPWDFDWKTLRAIADEAGALLLADIAHLAGMVVAGRLNNPLPYADVVTFTTHKTLCGPRGAAVVTTCREKAKRIDNAVFPGLQGGPHVNAIAGIARLFELILQDREGFVALQSRIVENCGVLAEALQAEGFALEYGGTNTHLLLLDLKRFKTKGGGRLDGETASRLLENVGLICNKNTLPGDRTAADSSGIRFGTPWLTQRGVTREQLKEIARRTREVLGSAVAFHVWAPSGEERCRGRVAFDTLLEARRAFTAIARTLPYPARLPGGDEVHSTSVVPATIGSRVGILVRGEKARLGLDQVLTCDVLGLAQGQAAQGFMLMPDGEALDDVVVCNLGGEPNPACGPNGEERLALFPHSSKSERVLDWLRAVSDGYVVLDASDPYLKIDGPLALESLPVPLQTRELRAAVRDLPNLPGLDGAPAGSLAERKPFFVGQKALKERLTAPALPVFEFKPEDGPLKKTLLHGWHKNAGAKLVPFAGWEMPVEYPDGIFAEHAAVRAAAGLFDVSHMSALEVAGPYALAFLECCLANAASRLIDNEAQYSYLLREDGAALDDLYVYRIAHDRFMVVVNAGNFERDFAWLNAVNEGRVRIDPEQPGKRAPGPVQLRALRDAGADGLLDLAFQGPLSMELLAELAGSDAERAALRAGKLNDIYHISVAGIPVRAARTGYTGEEVGYELFVHPGRAAELWEKLLAHGKDRGVRACGLGARDSLRTEAGFPLFGHELEGPEQLSLTEADYGFVSRFHRPFYIGRDAYIRRLSPRRKRILRLRGSGRRSVRGGHAILDAKGQLAGAVTSFSFSDPEFNFTVLAAVNSKFRPEEGRTVRAVRATPDQLDGEPDASKVVELTVLSRFPGAEEKAGWRAKYEKFLKK